MNRNLIVGLSVGLAVILMLTLGATLSQQGASAYLSESEATAANQGVTVTIVGSMDRPQLEPLLDDFTDRTGFATAYEQSNDPSRLSHCQANGDCPDVAMVPWPGLLRDLEASGTLIDLRPLVSSTVLNANYSDTWTDLGSVSETLYGVWFNAYNKSLVWYDPTEFAAHGWTTPTTWSEAMMLSQEISNTTGIAPWTIGNESGYATGWPLTDWFEDILLRSAGPDIYDGLITSSVPWTHTQVISAMIHFNELFGNDHFQLGGKQGTIQTNVFDAANPPFKNPPEAYLHRQASFAQTWIAGAFPAQTVGVDYDVFPFPDIDPAHSNVVLGGGDVAMAFSSGAGVQALFEYLISTDAAELWIVEGNTSPNRRADTSLYPDPVARAAAEALTDAEAFRFDLTDQLPSDLSTYVTSQMDDFVRAAPDLEATRRILTRVELKTTPQTTMTVAGFSSEDSYELLFDEFFSRTLITIDYKRLDDPSELQDCLSTSTCPDMALLERPGPLVHLAQAGALVELGTLVSKTLLVDNYSQMWLDKGKVDGELYGLPFDAQNKSLIWYDPKEFAAHCWTTPTTWADMMALTQQIFDTTGTAPWSAGNESGTATGWPLTDWFENILLRSAGPEVYDDLVAHDIPWTHTEVVSAATYFADVFGNDDYQLGGREGTLGTHFADAMYPPFTEPPQAYLHHQGSFAQVFLSGQFPDQTAGVDYAVFPFPDLNASFTTTVVGAYKLAVAFDAADGPRKLMSFLASTDAAQVWIAGGNVSLNRNADLNAYPDANTRDAAEQLLGAEVFRFDLTDQLPPDLMIYVWSQMDDLVRATPNAEAMLSVLSRIEWKAEGTLHQVCLPVILRIR